MNTAMIWIVFPAVCGAALLLVQRQRRLVYLLGILTATSLSLLAWLAPIGERIRLGSTVFVIEDTFTILGRSFILQSDDRFYLMLLYQGLAFWFGGAALAGVTRVFVPLGLGIVALLTAALSVDPFLYAAPLLALTALASVPLLTQHGSSNRGVLRLLTYIFIGFPFILLSGWLLQGLESVSPDAGRLLEINVVLGLGFAFLLGIFPLHTWITLLSYETNPYAVAFVLYELPLAVSILGLSFLDRYTWLKSDELFNVLRLVGVVMVLVGGVWAGFQRHLGRMIGQAAMMETGFSLMAISLLSSGSQPALSLFFTLILPRGLSLGIWALALVALQRGLTAEQGARTTAQALTYRNVQGIAWRYPFAAAALLSAHFSLAGFPLLAGFPARLALLDAIAGQNIAISLAALLGLVGLMAGGIRTLAVLIMSEGAQEARTLESLPQRLLLGLGAVMLVLVGFFPQWFTPFMAQMSAIFPNLSR